MHFNEGHWNILLLFADEREKVQRKTFTKWINSHLQRVGARINDLYHDLQDGKKLILLLEILSGEKLVCKLLNPFCYCSCIVLSLSVGIIILVFLREDVLSAISCFVYYWCTCSCRWVRVWILFSLWLFGSNTHVEFISILVSQGLSQVSV